MPDIHWVKLSTQMFKDEKIMVIQSMPSGSEICLIWIKLIVLAGTVNDNGCIYLARDVPYTDDMLAKVFNQPVEIVRVALQTFAHLGMIEILDDQRILLVNWDRHQNIAGLEKVRELTKLRVKRLRERRKAIACNVTVALSNATDSDSDSDSDSEIREEKSTEAKTLPAPTPTNVGKSGLPPVVFDWTEGIFGGISDAEAARWESAYPACDVEAEISKAAEWLLANPKQRKKNYRRFLTNWLSRTQERGGSRRGAR